MTDIEQDAAILAIQEAIVDIQEVLAGLSTAYVSKAQWKQLDTLKSGEIQTITQDIVNLTARVANLE